MVCIKRCKSKNGYRFISGQIYFYTPTHSIYYCGGSSNYTVWDNNGVFIGYLGNDFANRNFIDFTIYSKELEKVDKIFDSLLKEV